MLWKLCWEQVYSHAEIIFQKTQSIKYRWVYCENTSYQGERETSTRAAARTCIQFSGLFFHRVCLRYFTVCLRLCIIRLPDKMISTLAFTLPNLAGSAEINRNTWRVIWGHSTGLICHVTERGTARKIYYVYYKRNPFSVLQLFTGKEADILYLWWNLQQDRSNLQLLQLLLHVYLDKLTFPCEFVWKEGINSDMCLPYVSHAHKHLAKQAIEFFLNSVISIINHWYEN